MDVTKIKGLINQVNEELNTLIDGVVQGRKTNGMKGLARLNNASTALQLVETHVDAAAKQANPPAEAPAAPAAPARSASNKK